MGRIRTIKPEFTQDEELSALPAEPHLLAAGLLCYADDYGYFNANPGLVKAAVFPLRETSRKIPEMLWDLVGIGYLRLGTATDGKRFGHIVNFSKHQRVSHPTDSKISCLQITWDDSGNILEDSGSLTKHSALNREQGTGNREREQDLCAALVPIAPLDVVITVPLNDGSDYPVTKPDVDEWTRLYPAVDVLQELRNYKGWASANPKKRKTRRGIKSSINSWLVTAQDKQRPAKQSQPSFANTDYRTSYGLPEGENVGLL